MVDPPAHPDLLVVARILEVLAPGDRPLKRTQLQMAAGINYTQLERYLALLQGRGLVTFVPADDGKTYVALTTSGYSALGFLRKGIEDIVGARI
ncbi:MAG TPA: winged helix-turn-helix domain-containing protein [Thermoplasmata archaeon]|nr:winged helix-turn-helix domain-containing protein [Thermoplasmata archaeon]